MATKFADVCKIFFRFKDHRDKLVKRSGFFLRFHASNFSVLVSLPHLARFDPNGFAHRELNAWVNFLNATLRQTTPERSLAFIALGEITLVLLPQCTPYVH